MLEPLEEHVREHLGDLEHINSDWFELVDPDALSCDFAEDCIDSFIELCDVRRRYWFALRVVELGDVLTTCRRFLGHSLTSHTNLSWSRSRVECILPIL